MSRTELLERVKQALQTRHYGPLTEKAYVGWTARFLHAHPRAAPEDLGEIEIASFLSTLATEGRVSASTQNQALHSLLFFFEHVVVKRRGSTRKTSSWALGA